MREDWRVKGEDGKYVGDKFRIPEKIPEWLRICRDDSAVYAIDIVGLFGISEKQLMKMVREGRFPKPDSERLVIVIGKGNAKVRQGRRKFGWLAKTIRGLIMGASAGASER